MKTIHTHVKALWSMSLIALLELFALYQHVDGVALAGVIAILAGLGGFVVGKPTK